MLLRLIDYLRRFKIEIPIRRGSISWDTIPARKKHQL